MPKYIIVYPLLSFGSRQGVDCLIGVHKAASEYQTKEPDALT